MRIALTGGICDGKSTVLGMIAEHGFFCLEADPIAKEVIENFIPKVTIKQVLGSDAVVNDQINTEYLRKNLTNLHFRRELNRLVHGKTIELIFERTEGKGTSFIEIPLLIETAIQGLFDRVWVVEAGQGLQLERLIQRLQNVEAAKQLLALQLPTAVKTLFAHQNQRTDLPLDTVRLQVENKLQELN